MSSLSPVWGQGAGWIWQGLSTSWTPINHLAHPITTTDPWCLLPLYSVNPASWPLRALSSGILVAHIFVYKGQGSWSQESHPLCTDRAFPLRLVGEHKKPGTEALEAVLPQEYGYPYRVCSVLPCLLFPPSHPISSLKKILVQNT